MLDEDTGGLVDMISGYFGGTINTGAGLHGAHVVTREHTAGHSGSGQLVGTIKR